MYPFTTYTRLVKEAMRDSKVSYMIHQVPNGVKAMALSRKVGCDICKGSGYTGCVAIHELFLSTDEITKAIRHKDTADELRIMAIKDGMRTMIMDGIQKFFREITDLEDILQVPL